MRRSSSRRAAVGLGIGLVVLWGGTAPAATAAPVGVVRGDYDGDGRADLAVGAPHVLANGQTQGAVLTRDSTTGELAAHTVDPSGDDRPDSFDLGEVVASCDLDGDRYADLVSRTAFDFPWSGLPTFGLQVFRGTPTGLTTAGRVLEVSHGVGYTTEIASLACGDLDGDGYDEVALGVPGASVRGAEGAGEVVLYRGSPQGPSADRAQVITQDLPGLHARSEAGDDFGTSVAFGDVDRDGYADLVVGAWHETPRSGSDDPYDEGAVAVLRGGRQGVDVTRSQYLEGASLGVTGDLGLGLAVGDLTGDGKDDIAVGAPTQLVRGNSFGAVAVLKGRTGPLKLDQVITQADKGVGGAAGPENGFGLVLAVGDVDGDHRADLVVGAPGQTVSGRAHAGSLTVLPGTAGGVDRKKSRFVTLSTRGVPGKATRDDSWPHALSVLDSSGDGRGEVYASLVTDRGGAVYRLPGSAKGTNPGRATRLVASDLEPVPTPGLLLGRSIG